jgi:coenzyme F420 biosynthesis associated uncharacterized protein
VEKEQLLGQNLAKTLSRLSAGNDRLSEAHLENLASDFDVLSQKALDLVARHTGWSYDRLPSVKVVYRHEWIQANIDTFSEAWSNLIEPAIKTSVGTQAATETSKTLALIQLSLMLGWLSRRVLGQYSFAFSGASKDVDVYYVGFNIVNLENRFAFYPREFRLWLALHEITHFMQFESIKWLNGYFQELVKQSVSFALPNIGDLAQGLKRLLNQLRSGSLNDMSLGIAGLLGNEQQLEVLKKVQVLMSLIEGQADLVMSVIGESVLDQAPRFARILKARRLSAKGIQKLLQQLLGLEAKLRQYADGEKFLRVIYSELGSACYEKVFESPESLPTIQELADPQKWLHSKGLKIA